MYVVIRIEIDLSMLPAPNSCTFAPKCAEHLTNVKAACERIPYQEVRTTNCVTIINLVHTKRLGRKWSNYGCETTEKCRLLRFNNSWTKRPSGNFPLKKCVRMG
jgi:hypothetical protein